MLALAGGQWRFTLCRDLGEGTAMHYSFTPPLALEAAYLATSAPGGPLFAQGLVSYTHI